MMEVLFLAKGRMNFTAASFTTLLASTAWEKVSKLVVYDDGSSKFDQRCLSDLVRRCPAEHEFRTTEFGSPVAVMNDYLDQTETELFAKIDNDIIVPPGWETALLSVMERHPELDLLGAEPGMSSVPPNRDGQVAKGDTAYDYTEATHIGGVGLMKVQAFRQRPRLAPNGYFGFTEWQHNWRPSSGWIKPDLHLFSLDRLPFEPWSGWTREYVKARMNRDHTKYDPKMSYYWKWWLP